MFCGIFLPIGYRLVFEVIERKLHEFTARWFVGALSWMVVGGAIDGRGGWRRRRVFWTHGK